MLILIMQIFQPMQNRLFISDIDANKQIRTGATHLYLAINNKFMLEMNNQNRGSPKIIISSFKPNRFIEVSVKKLKDCGTMTILKI